MELQLSDDEATVLADVLDTTIADLSPEIADTDNPGYRAALRDRREVLRGLRSKCNGA